MRRHRQTAVSSLVWESDSMSRMQTIRLESAQLGFWVDLRMLNVRGRWMAVALIGGDPEVGYGPTRSLALRRALAPLGSEATDELLREPDDGSTA
jgi:hypothetical protein